MCLNISIQPRLAGLTMLLLSWGVTMHWFLAFVLALTLVSTSQESSAFELCLGNEDVPGGGCIVVATVPMPTWVESTITDYLKISDYPGRVIAWGTWMHRYVANQEKPEEKDFPEYWVMVIGMDGYVRFLTMDPLYLLVYRPEYQDIAEVMTLARKAALRYDSLSTQFHETASIDLGEEDNIRLIASSFFGWGNFLGRMPYHSLEVKEVFE